MKKLLSLLLTVILTFGCVSILGTSTATAATVQRTIMSSDFANDYGDWSTTNGYSGVSYNKNEASLTINATVDKYIFSPTFSLVPGNQYKLSFKICVPTDGVMIANGKIYGPRFAIFEAQNNGSDNKVTNNPDISANSSNNLYAKQGVRRDNIGLTWAVEGEKTITDEDSLFDSTEQTKINSTTDPKDVYSTWKQITATFTATASSENEGAQLAAIAFGLDFTASNRALSIKEITLVETLDESDLPDPSDVTAEEASELLLESDFHKSKYSSTNAGTSRWKTINTSDVVSHMSEGDDSFVRINSRNGKTTFSSPAVKLVSGKTYELSYYIRVPNTSKDFYSGSTTKRVPTTVIYKPGNTSVGGVAQSGWSESVNEFAYGDNSFSAVWDVENYGAATIKEYSIFGYNQYTQITNSSGVSLSPNEVYANWTKVTATFTANKTAIVSVAFSQQNSTTGYIFDVKDVILKTASSTDDTVLPADTAFSNDFEDAKASDIEAAEAETTVKKAEGEPQKIGSNYFEYKTTGTGSKGVTVRFNHNKDYTYKISYDLKVFAKGTGSLTTSLVKSSANKAISTENDLLVYDQNGKTTSLTAFSKTFSDTDSTEWNHFEIEIGANSYIGFAKLNIVAGNGWNVGIDNIKVEMVSNANISKAEEATDGTYAFNIRLATEDKKQGLRFKSSICLNSLELENGAKIVEYGTLAAKSENAHLLKREAATDMAKSGKVIAGVAYSLKDDIDVRYSLNGSTNVLTYTGVLTGLSVEKYEVDFAVCGYAVVETTSGTRFTVYDEVKTISIYEAAQQIFANPKSDSDKAAAQAVIEEYDAYLAG